MKRITKILAFTLIIVSVLSVAAYAAYDNYWTNSKQFFHGTGTAFESTQTGQYGRLIWKQDFEGYCR